MSVRLEQLQGGVVGSSIDYTIYSQWQQLVDCSLQGCRTLDCGWSTDHGFLSLLT